MNVADALSGSAGLEGIRWMLNGTPLRALRRELGALLTAPDMLGSCQLRRVRFKPGQLLVYYDVHIGAEGDDVHSVRPAAVTWTSYGDGDLHHAAADLAKMEDEAMRRGLLAPFRRLVADAPSSGMHVRVSPLDVRFPQLVRVCDPEYVRDMVASASAASGRAPDHAPSSRYSVTSIRYRPGQKHVLRYDPLDAPEGRAVFAKLYSTSEDSERVFRLAKQIEEWLALRRSGVTSVRPLAHVAEDAVILYPQILGTPLAKHLRHSGQDVASLLKATGAALFALHQLPVAVAGSLGNRKRPASFRAEVKDIAQTSKHVAALLPSVGGTLSAVLGRAQELYERLPLEPPAFTYGDFKSAHLLITPDGLTLIDFDSCRLDDPALDVGKFLADLRFWCTVNGQLELEQVQEQFLAGYGPGAPAERLVRARLYEVIELVKETVRRVRLYKGDWAYRTEQLIGYAQAALNDFQLGLGPSAEVKKKVKHAYS